MKESSDRYELKVPERPAVNCPRCKRIFNVPDGQRAGDVIGCPFCYAKMRLAERTMLIAEDLEAA